MRFLSVCSGIEAATVAWEPLGFEALAYSEIADFPRALLEYHYPFTDLHGDFTKIGRKYNGSTDILIGGTPCQDFSVAGLRKGLAGDRGQLTIEFIRLAERTRSRWLVWENVPGVLSIDKGRAFGTFLKALAECGYGFAYRVLDAQYFGVPQRRRRVFVVGYLGDWRPAAAVLFERESLRGDITPRRKTRESFTYDVANSITASGRGTERAGDSRGQDSVIPTIAPTLDGRSGRSGANGFATSGGLIPELAGCLQERDSKGCDSDTKPGHLIPFYSNMSGTQQSAASDVSLALKTAGTNAIAIPIQEIGKRTGDHDPSAGIGIGNSGDPMFTLQANAQHGVMSFKAGQSATSRSIGADENLSPSLEGAGGGNNQPALLHNMGVRRLTPRECERLMGFPDDYTLIPFGKPTKKKMNEDFIKYLMRGGKLSREECHERVSDTHRYKALGNSMAVPVIRWLGERIEAVDDLL